MVTSFEDKVLAARGEKFLAVRLHLLGRGATSAIAANTAMTGSSTITVISTTGFSSSGTLQINNELFTYTG